MRYITLSVLLLLPITLHAENYAAEIATWRQERLDRLRAEEGFLSLAGLYWLQEGANRFGSGEEDNDLIFPEGTPAHIGVFTLEKGRVSAQIAADIRVTRIDSAKQETVVQALDFPHLMEADPQALRLGSLRFYPIESAVDTVHSSGEHLLELINEVLDISKIEAGRLQLNIETSSSTSACRA